jgi:hypothetical protein
MDVFALADIQTALRGAGAEQVSARRAYGGSTMPRAATFRAATDDEATRLCDAARATLRPGSLPGLLPYRYQS